MSVETFEIICCEKSCEFSAIYPNKKIVMKLWMASIVWHWEFARGIALNVIVGKLSFAYFRFQAVIIRLRHEDMAIHRT